jgi:hypothetical protein
MLKTINGSKFLDLEQLWNSVKGIAPELKLRQLLKNSGVIFYDEELNYIKFPSVAMSAIGGIPLHIDHNYPDNVIALKIAPDSNFCLNDLLVQFKSMMGFSSFCSYLNPRDVSGVQMADITMKHGHYSVAHIPNITVFISGHSSGVEHELSVQRDLVHLSRLTVARTKAQLCPPIVVPSDDWLNIYADVYSKICKSLEKLSDQQDPDFYEERNLLFPAAKGSLCLLTGSLRSFQKLVSQRKDSGKEKEYVQLLNLINNLLTTICPEMFQGE